MSRPAYQSTARWRVGVVALVVIAAALSSCSGPTIDGWTVGKLDVCPEPNVPMGETRPQAWDCAATVRLWLDAARDGFDKRDPGHPAIVRATLHYYAGPARFLSNCCDVAVFALADGSVRAIGVAHLGVDSTKLATVPDGPDD